MRFTGEAAMLFNNHGGNKTCIVCSRRSFAQSKIWHGTLQIDYSKARCVVSIMRALHLTPPLTPTTEPAVCVPH